MVGVQVQLTPPTTPICAWSPIQIIVSPIASTTKTSTKTVSVLKQPFASVPSTTYSVGKAGAAVGLEMFALLKPVAGVHS